MSSSGKGKTMLKRVTNNDILYLVYETSHIDSGKIYVGKHQTRNIDDGYLGSGKYLRSAIKKYGTERFTRRVLAVFQTKVEMDDYERHVVDANFCLRKDTYNIKLGGEGGFDHINAAGSTSRIGVGRKLSEANRGKRRPALSRTSKAAVLDGRIILTPGEPFTAEHRVKAKSEESRRKRKETFAEQGHKKGSSNSSFGTMWITNEVTNTKVVKDEAIPDGWRRGRVMKAA